MTAEARPRTREELRTGRREPLAEPVLLRAGPTTALLDGADLRAVCRGGRELAQRVYMAVRDEVWGTVPAEISDVQVEQAGDRFHATFSARCRQGPIDFEWAGDVTGEPDGRIVYAFSGIASSAFRYCKIGFNVHHPLLESVGRRFRATTPDGEIEGVLPERIEPQRVVDGVLTGMFPPYSALAIDYLGGAEARFAFEGDLFELQDHRNWADGNYKSYGTPLSVPWPVDATAGQRFEQRVVLDSVGLGDALPGDAPLRIRVESEGAGGSLPRIGLGHAAELERPFSPPERELIRLAAPKHLRVPVRLHDDSWRECLRAGLEAATAVGAELELAVSVEEEGEDGVLAALADELEAGGPPVARVLVLERQDEFTPTAPITSERSLARARRALGAVVGGAAFAGGSDQFFSDLNRGAPGGDDLDALCFGLCPQVHAADDRSLMENLAAFPDCVASARALRPGKSVAVTPVTLVARLGPYPGGAPDPDGLPGSVDTRLMALFGASWALGAVAWLARAGTESVTLFETVGWRGIVERDEGSPLSALVPSRPGDAFPVWHVLADLGELAERALLPARSEDPLAASVLAFRRDGGLSLLLANHRPDSLPVAIEGLPGSTAHVRKLDETTAEVAMQEAAAFRDTRESVPCPGGRLDLVVAPYGFLRIDTT